MNKTTEELLTELNTMQTNNIKVLEERIKVLQNTIKINKQTIKMQNDTINNYLKIKSNE